MLASTSPWRRKMLEDAGVRVEAVASGFDERSVHDADPVALARRLAAGKAEAVAALRPGDWVLGADQVVYDGDEVFGKPSDPQDHRARLLAMRGRRHALVTAWALRGPGEPADGVAVTWMHTRAEVSEAEIERYVATGEGSGCAGGYAVEGRGSFLFERVEGDWFNVIGLPLLDVMTALRARGWRFGLGRG
ncbi:MAG TPA: nucleoside triphosphate pyrophosphatase, partial [Myxococcota bacterium]|nr:nucleoside triphosphate pyrophosphatase [Myxococcota bacterium]